MLRLYFNSNIKSLSKRLFGFGNSRGGGFRNNESGGGYGGFGGRGSNQSQNIQPIKFDVAKLEPFHKDLYEEHPDVTALSEKDIETFHKESGMVIDGMKAPNPVLKFDKIILPEQMQKDIIKIGFGSPTPIQSQAWPVMLKGHDLVGVAETGSGKTLAFALPSLLHVSAQPHTRGGEGPIVLVLAPVRELAQQIYDEFATKFKSTTGDAGIKIDAVYGQMSIGKRQTFENNLSRVGVDILVASPGRIIDLMSSGRIDMSRCTMIVIDEADRMLDMGFAPQLEQIFGQIRPDRQVCMFSATWPREVKQIARKFLNDPVLLSVSHSGEGPSANPKANPRV